MLNLLRYCILVVPLLLVCKREACHSHSGIRIKLDGFIALSLGNLKTTELKRSPASDFVRPKRIGFDCESGVDFAFGLLEIPEKHKVSYSKRKMALRYRAI